MKPAAAVIPNAVSDPRVQEDQDWFAANPERMLRLRETMPGELQATMADFDKTVPPEVPGYSWVTVSYQIRPGERTRCFRQVPHDSPIDGLGDLEIAAHLFSEGDLETAEERFDKAMASSSGLARIDALMRRVQSRLAAFEENAQ